MTRGVTFFSVREPVCFLDTEKIRLSSFPQQAGRRR